MGIQETFAALRMVRSKHVVPALLLAVESTHSQLRTFSVKALIGSRDDTAHRALLYRFPELPMAAQDAICNSVGAMRKVIQEAIRLGDDGLRTTVMDILELNTSVDAAEPLCEYLTDANLGLRTRAEQGLRKIVERFSTEREEADEPVYGPDGTEKRNDTRQMRKRERVNEKARLLFRALKVAMDGLVTHQLEFTIEACLRVGGDCKALISEALRNERERRQEGPVERFLKNNSDVRTLEYLLERLTDHRADIRACATQALAAKQGSDVNTNLAFILDEQLDDETLRRILQTSRGIPWMACMQGFIERYSVRLLRRLLREVERLQTMQGDDRAQFFGLLAEGRDAQLADEAFELLCSMSIDDSGATLARLTRSRRQRTVLRAFETMVRREHQGVVQVATKLIDSHWDAVREAATTYLANRAWKRYAESFEKLPEPERRRTGAALRHVGDEVIADLRVQIASADPSVRVRALRLLDMTSNVSRVGDAVVQLMRDPDAKVRATVVGLLAALRSTEAIQAIGTLLNDADRRVRANAIEAVEALGERSLARALVPFLSDDNNRVRANAAKALYSFGVQEAAEVMLAMLHSDNELMRMSAVWAIRETRPPGATEWLLARKANEKAPGILERIDAALRKLATPVQEAG
ncbi:MAG: HEAT repeat domain-containing protein [Planctomycetes bacterium]|nr:HEAT repeat domain-containing protein [Planctomycetota bacterium]